MNFTEMNDRESTFYPYVRGQITNQVPPYLYATLDRNTTLPIWEQVWDQVWTHIHWNTYNKLNGR